MNSASDILSSFRQPSFANEQIEHEEPEPEEAAASVGPTAKPNAPTKTVRFHEKTAGTRATRSQNATVVRGMNTSSGYAMLCLGLCTLSTAIYAMGTTNVMKELSKPDGSLSAALAKPSSVDPKNQEEAYAQDKPGWQKSEDKELKNHAANGSWEYITATATWSPPRQTRLGLQGEAQWVPQVVPVCPRLQASCWSRLRPNLMRRHAWDVAACPRQPRRKLRHVHAPVRFRRRLPPGQAARRRDGILLSTQRL